MNANQVTSAIIEYIQLTGNAAHRINVIGVPLPGGKFRPSPNRGVADIIACIDGRYVGIEVKIGRDKQSVYQKKYQEDIESSGGIYFICSSLSNFIELFENINKKK